MEEFVISRLQPKIFDEQFLRDFLQKSHIDFDILWRKMGYKTRAGALLACKRFQIDLDCEPSFMYFAERSRAKNAKSIYKYFNDISKLKDDYLYSMQMIKVREFATIANKSQIFHSFFNRDPDVDEIKTVRQRNGTILIYFKTRSIECFKMELNAETSKNYLQRLWHCLQLREQSCCVCLETFSNITYDTLCRSCLNMVCFTCTESMCNSKSVDEVRCPCCRSTQFPEYVMN